MIKFDFSHLQLCNESRRKKKKVSNTSNFPEIQVAENISLRRHSPEFPLAILFNDQ